MDTRPVPVNAKLDLIVQRHDLTITARELAEQFSASGAIFDRAGPVRVSPGHPATVSKLTPHGVVNLTHQLVHPIEEKKGERKFVTLPDQVAQLYLALDGEGALAAPRGDDRAPAVAGWHDKGGRGL